MRLYTREGARIIEWELITLEQWDRLGEISRGFISYCNEFRPARRTGNSYIISEGQDLVPVE